MDLGALTSGALIGLREGVEAALIVAIALSYLARSGNGRHAGKIWVGALGAVAASAVFGTVLYLTVGALKPPYEQLFEGGLLLVAATVVTWMLFWMRRASAAMRGELQAAVDRALGEGTAWSLAVLAFTAVIREGIETALFLAGRATSSAPSAPSVAGGALLGLGAAALIGWGFYRGSRRVDLRRFFRWTGIALVFIAAGLLSQAVHELVEVAGIAGINVIGSGIAYDLTGVLSQDEGIGQFLRAIFGYSSSPEILTLAVHVAYIVGILWLYLRPARPISPEPQTRVASA